MMKIKKQCVSLAVAGLAIVCASCGNDRTFRSAQLDGQVLQLPASTLRITTDPADPEFNELEMDRPYSAMEREFAFTLARRSALKISGTSVAKAGCSDDGKKAVDLEFSVGPTRIPEPFEQDPASDGTELEPGSYRLRLEVTNPSSCVYLSASFSVVVTEKP